LRRNHVWVGGWPRNLPIRVLGTTFYAFFVVTTSLAAGPRETYRTSDAATQGNWHLSFHKTRKKVHGRSNLAQKVPQVIETEVAISEEYGTERALVFVRKSATHPNPTSRGNTR